MGSKELSVELRDRIVLRHRSGEGYQKISAELKIPKNTVGLLKWKKFGTNKTLPRAGNPAKLSIRGRRAVVREATKNRAPEFLCGESSRTRTISAALHQLGLYGTVVRRSHSSVKDSSLLAWSLPKGT